MSSNIGPVVLVPGIQQQLSLINIPNIQALKVTNGTPFDITYSGFGTRGNSIIPAGLEYMLYAKFQNSGYLNLLAVNNAGVSGNGVVNVVLFDTGEELPPGVWPVSVPTQTVSANVSTVQTLSNESATSGTLVIDMGIIGNTALIQMFNDGHGNWYVLQGSVLHKAITVSTTGNPLQLGQAGDTVEVLGGLLIDGVGNALAVTNGATISGTGVSALNVPNGDVATLGVRTNDYGDSAGNDGMVITPGSTTRILSAGQVVIQVPGGSTRVTISSTSVGIPLPVNIGGNLSLNNSNTLIFNNGGTISGLGAFTGTGTGTYNHGFGRAPAFFWMTAVGSGSSTFGYNTVTSTQVSIVEAFTILFKCYCID
jgi:hypothetical protein